MRQKKMSIGARIISFPFIAIYFVLRVVWSVLSSIVTFFVELIRGLRNGPKPMDGYQYEEFVAKYLRRHGFTGVEVTQASGDYGVDVVASKKGKKYAIQCKYYSQPVGVAAVQQAKTGMAHYGCNAAMVITNNTFTPQAETLAAENNVELLSNVI